MSNNSLPTLPGFITSAAECFWSWWYGELNHLFSQFSARWQKASRLGIYVDERGWTFFDKIEDARKDLVHVSETRLSSGADLSELRSTQHRRSDVDIYLSSELGLSRSVSLPKEARSDLTQILQFDLDRLTPFSAGDVYVDFRIEKTNRDAQKMDVALAAIPKNVIDSVVSHARTHGLSIKSIALEGSPKFNFSKFAPKTARGHASALRRYGPVALGVCALIGGLGIKINDQKNTIRKLDTDISSLRLEAEAHAIRRKQFEDQVTATQTIATAKTSRRTFTELLAELTRLVPDNAYLIQLIVDERTVELYGMAENAATLINVLEQSNMFHAPRFASPVTMDNEAGREQFHLKAQIVKTPS